MQPRVAILPPDAELGGRTDATGVAALRHRQIVEAIETNGGTVVAVDDANVLVWLATGNAQALTEVLDANPTLEWVQLPWAGVETFVPSGLFKRSTTFTCAKAAYGGQVGEHAFMLVLAALRNLVRQARTQHWCPTEPEGVEAKRVTVLGAGGISETLVRYLDAGRADITVLRRTEEPFPGPALTLSIDRLHDVLPRTDVLVLALALTPATAGIIGAEQLALLPKGAVLVNVARGGHVDTDALTASLQSGHLAAAGLDVTEPEPLPAEHPLWAMHNVLITSHCADSVLYVAEKLAERVGANVAALVSDSPLVGVVDPDHSY